MESPSQTPFWHHVFMLYGFVNACFFEFMVLPTCLKITDN